MSESNNSAWPFGELEDSGGLDVSAIFGDSAGGSDTNPFDTPAAQPQAAAPEPVPAPQPKPEETPAPQTQAHSAAPAAIEQPKPQAAPEGQTRKPDAPASAEPANPIAAAFGQQEEKAAQTAAKSLFEKPPVFAHKSVKEDIEDASMTFEELRIAKADDFPELGEFIAPKHKVTEFQQVRAGFRPALPFIPLPLIQQIISFFRTFMLENQEYEALALIYWDKVEQRFFAYVPKQTVRKEHIEADLRDCPYDDDPRYIRYADIHSHNSMAPFFSPEDNWDERGTGLYFVVGHLERFFPELKARISCEGSFVEIDPAEVIDWPDGVFPEEWSKNVVCERKSMDKQLSRHIWEVSSQP